MDSFLSSNYSAENNTDWSDVSLYSALSTPVLPEYKL